MRWPHCENCHGQEVAKPHRRVCGQSSADAIGLTFQQVQKYENGINRISASRLAQIAHVLQVSVPFFFEGVPGASSPPKGKAMAPSTAYVSEFLSSSDGRALIKAFMQIKDAKLRRRIVNLVEQIAGSHED
jgi:transcriptional regulator with XRE-family HTH domain